MSDFDLEGMVSPEVLPIGRGRKRVRNPNEWVKTKRKLARNSSEEHARPQIACNHLNTESKSCKVRYVSEEVIAHFHSQLYDCKSKVDQDNFILKYTMIKERSYMMISYMNKRRRPRNPNNTRKPRLLTDYFVRK